MVILKERMNIYGSVFRSTYLGIDEKIYDYENLMRYRYILYNYLEGTRIPGTPNFRPEFDRSMFTLWGTYGYTLSPLFGFGMFQLSRYLMGHKIFR